MKDPKCPNCDLVLPAAHLASGWCEDCGHKIPLFVYEAIGAKSPDEKALSRSQVHRDRPSPAAPPEDVEEIPKWKLLLLGIAVLSIAAFIVRAAI